MSEVLKQRMYHLVMGNLSPIQLGIQAYHSGIEYALEHSDTPEFRQWAVKDKTVIILNGGTSNRQGFSEYDEPPFNSGLGTIEKAQRELMASTIKFSVFYEPDLNNATAAIAFLADERVWDKEKYPDTETIMHGVGDVPGVFSQIKLDPYVELEKKYGADVAFLRIFLKQFRLV